MIVNNYEAATFHESRTKKYRTVFFFSKLTCYRNHFKIKKERLFFSTLECLSILFIKLVSQKEKKKKKKISFIKRKFRELLLYKNNFKSSMVLVT